MDAVEIEDSASNQPSRKDVARAKAQEYFQHSQSCFHALFVALCNCLPDSEVLLFTIVTVSFFVRAEEAHIREYCRNEGSLGWILICVGMCIAMFAKFSDTRSPLYAVAAGGIYFLLHISLYYSPLGCLFTAYTAGDYNIRTKRLAVFQTFILIMYAILYAAIIAKRRMKNKERERQ